MQQKEEKRGAQVLNLRIVQPVIGQRGGNSGQKKKVCKKINAGHSRHSTHKLGPSPTPSTMASVQVVNATLPTLPQGWAGEKDFKIVGALSGATQRNVEPVGPHFLAHARRVSSASLFYCCFVCSELKAV
jgi:hypothetical protein